MTYFFKHIAATALSVALSSTVFANQSCDVELSTAVNIDSNKTEFTQEATSNEKAHTLYQIDNGTKLSVAGKTITLTAEQQAIVSQYDKDIRQLVPQVKKVAIDGIDSAIEGVNAGFNGLLGNGNKLVNDLTTELVLIRSQVENNLSIEKGIFVGTDGIEGEDILGKDFEQRIKSSVQNAVVNSMGSILMAIGQQMMFDNGQGGTFDTRVKKFTDNIEQEIATRTEKIEQESNMLCPKIINIDVLEWKLKTNINALANINVFTVTKNVSRDVTKSVTDAVSKTVEQTRKQLVPQGN
ncbi:DUF2884 family protein [Colwellia sp. E2M01]|uniref:DUF2884 family protein n=1 Tax=Colwellia sp. E2M01 TaxID=2841561 RepID=UPI001C0A3C2E|nr:DUF2884 family protein [Colwellia sp. E2M01]MBU2869912.1 YggN family protein [Colwellia sp. E2M01]